MVQQKGRTGGKKKKAKGKKKASPLLRGFGFLCTCIVKFSCLVILLGMISLLFVTIYGYFLKSPYLRIEEVVITGVDERLKEALLDLSGIAEGTNFLAADLFEAQKRMEEHPWVHAVTIEKHFPKGLTFRVQRESPTAVVALDKLYYMNPRGKIFAEAGQLSVTDYPIITGVSTEDEHYERHLSWAAEVLQELKSEKSPWSIEELSEVHVEKEGTLDLYFDSFPAEIHLRGGELREKMGDIKKVVAHLKETGQIHRVRGINLVYQGGAVVSFNNG
jgi:cell division protein FtsQ